MSERVAFVGRNAVPPHLMPFTPPPPHHISSWSVLYLQLQGMDNILQEQRRKYPITVEVISSLLRAFGHAFFSALSPGVHIKPHHGPTNRKLRIYLPLIIPDGKKAALRVGGETRLLEEGETLLFDDSFEHESADHQILERVRRHKGLAANLGGGRGFYVSH